MANKRVIEYPEILSPVNGDYLLVDNNTEGTRKIKASAVGGGYSKTLLYDSGSDITGATVGTDINLLDNLSNYDMGVIMAATYNDRNTPNDISASQFFFDVDYVLGGESVNKIHLASYGTRWCLISFTDTTFNVERSGGESGGYELTVYKIYGIKF